LYWQSGVVASGTPLPRGARQWVSDSLASIAGVIGTAAVQGKVVGCMGVTSSGNYSDGSAYNLDDREWRITQINVMGALGDARVASYDLFYHGNWLWNVDNGNPGMGRWIDRAAYLAGLAGVDSTSPLITGWSSAATHGGVGEVLLTIPDDGTFSEPRNTGVRRLVVNFSEAVNPATFMAGSVQIAGHDINGNDLNLSGISIVTSLRNGNTEGVIDFSAALPNVARYVVRVQGVTDVAGNALAGDNDRIITALIGDATGDRRTNTTDLSLIWANRINPISPTNVNQVRSDVFTDGRVNTTDLSGAWGNRADARFIPDPVLSLGMVAASQDFGGSPARGSNPLTNKTTVPTVGTIQAVGATLVSTPTGSGGAVIATGFVSKPTTASLAAAPKTALAGFVGRPVAPVPAVLVQEPARRPLAVREAPVASARPGTTLLWDLDDPFVDVLGTVTAYDLLRL